MDDAVWKGFRGTVRLRIALSSALVVTLGLVVTSVVLVRVVQRDLERTLDAELERKADAIEALLDDQAQLESTLGARVGDEFLAEVISEGERVAATDNLDRVAQLDTTDLESPVGDLSDVPVDDGAFQVLVRATDQHTIVVAWSLDAVSDRVGFLAGALAVAVPLLTLAFATLAWLLVGRTLRPVEAIRAEVASLGGTGDLDRRVPVPHTRDEIARLALTMNDMLGRIERSGAQQRAFVGDASHELRIPLTRLRTQLEVQMGAGLDPESALSLHGELIGLQNLVEDLLALAQLDAQKAPARLVRADLDEIVRAEATPYSDRQTMPILDLEPVVVLGDIQQLRRAIRNLINNARRHARSRISISLRTHNELATVIVEDDGAGIPSEDRRRVFDRFTRLDDSRNADAGGSGLGLAIVAAIVEAHAGTVHVEDASPGTRVVLTIPAVS